MTDDLLREAIQKMGELSLQMNTELKRLEAERAELRRWLEGAVSILREFPGLAAPAPLSDWWFDNAQNWLDFLSEQAESNPLLDEFRDT